MNYFMISIGLNIVLLVSLIFCLRSFLKVKKLIPKQRGNVMTHMMRAGKIKLWMHNVKDNKIYYANDKIEYGEGIPFEDHLLLKAEEDRQKCLDHVDMLEKHPEIVETTLAYKYIDPAFMDGYRYVNNYMFIQRDKNKNITAAYSLEHDVTDYEYRIQKLEKMLEETQEASRNKSAFVATASHDLRTPLNGIIGFTQLLCEDISYEERQELYPLIKQNTDQLQSLVNDILDISKIEAGKMEFYYVDLHLDELMADMMRTFEVQKSDKQILTLNEPQAPVTISFDRQRFMQIVNNFASNALKFTEEGTIAITYTYDEDEGFYLEVKDSGLGIREEDKPRIFMQFQKLNYEYQGTGLGLSICKAIVESQGGEIGYESTLGKGSTFWFSLPAEKVAPKKKQA